MGSDGTCVPHELSAPNYQRLPRHVRKPELQPHVNQVHRVHARPRHRHHRRKPPVHVQTRRPLPPYRQRVEEQRVDCQRHPTRQKQRPVPRLHALAPRVQNRPERARIRPGNRPRDLPGPVLDWNQVGARGRLPLGLVTAVTAGGVEHGHTHLCARVTLHRAGDWTIIIRYCSSGTSFAAAVSDVVDCIPRIPPQTNPPVKEVEA